jgi:hypothetical protein
MPGVATCRRHWSERLALALFAGLAFPASAALAQQEDAVLRGLVTNQDGGAPVAGAEVFLDSSAMAVTDASGRFAVSGIRPAEYRLSVRAIGFQPFEVILNLPESMTYEVELPIHPGAMALEALTVEALRLPRNRVGDVVERMAWGAGDFITRSDLDEWHPLETSMALARSTKVKLYFVGMGECLEEVLFGRGSEATSRFTPDAGARNPSSPAGGPCAGVQQRPGMQVLMGRGARRCVPSLFLDGVRYQTIPGILIDDIVHPHDIELIEVYGEFEVPGEFANADVGCGVIAIWTRVG